VVRGVLDKTGVFLFEWIEAGGPEVKVPDRKGFGTTFSLLLRSSSVETSQ